MDVGIPEFFIVLVIVMLVFGPNRIARLGGELGNAIRDFREGLTRTDDGHGLHLDEQENQDEASLHDKKN